MLDFSSLSRCLRTLGLDSWRRSLQPILAHRFSAQGHGDFPRWQKLVAGLPSIDSSPATLNSDTICAGPTDLDPEVQRAIQSSLLGLAPWRKGPFELCGIGIDAEWRSNLKWSRLTDAIAPLAGRNVLDVGCGNGYYALRMRGAGSRCVIGIDPTLLYVMQFFAVQHFINDAAVIVLPLRLHELPESARVFDTTFSMGVLYHQRSSIAHLQQLQATLRPGGQLVLETIFMPDDKACTRMPGDRYARMRNVWQLPTTAELVTWLARCGFCDIEIVDESVTTVAEQRSTQWMTFESLAAALDPDDPSRTVEGWPAPRRVVVLANAP